MLIPGIVKDGCLIKFH